MPNLPMPDGLGTSDLECVMLDVNHLRVHEAFGEGAEDDLFYGTTPELKYAQGAVAESSAHLTLLFGIHPRPDYREAVDGVLEGWEPGLIQTEDVSYFPSSLQGENYNVIILKVALTENVIDANERLSTLDYTTRFVEYKPHITLAYIKGSADLNTWLGRMSAFAFKTYTPLGINYGD